MRDSQRHIQVLPRDRVRRVFERNSLCKRSSGIVDTIPIVFSERLDVPNIAENERVSVTGQVRSYSSKCEEKEGFHFLYSQI